MEHGSWIAAALVAGLGFVAFDPAIQGGADPGEIPWRTGLGAARVEAAGAGKPLLILVRCPP